MVANLSLDNSVKKVMIKGNQIKDEFQIYIYTELKTGPFLKRNQAFQNDAFKRL